MLIWIGLVFRMASNPKKRDCPALGKIIKRNDCGENRVSRYACPASCEFNPFGLANYTELLELEAALDNRMVTFLSSLPEFSGRIEAALKKAERAAYPDVAIHDVFHQNLFLTPSGDGRSVAEKFYEFQGAKLKNDMKILLRAKEQSRVALLEVRDVLADDCICAVDLLRSEAGLLTFCDRAWAKRAVRYDIGICWIYPLPYFNRLSGVLIEWMDLGLGPVDQLLEISKKHGGPAHVGSEIDVWLGKNLVKVCEIIHDAAYHRQRLVYERVDGMLCRATFETLGDVDVLIERLVMEDGVEVCDAPLSDQECAQGFTTSWDWLVPADEADDLFGEMARGLIGRVLLGRDSVWRIEALGEARYHRLRSAFENCLKDEVTFVSERKDNIAGKTLNDHKPLDPKTLELIPSVFFEKLPNLDFTQSRISVDLEDGEELGMIELRQKQLRAWLDQPLPLFKGRTPREAAASPELQGEVHRIVKQMIRSLDKDALAEGTVADVDWIYDVPGLEAIRARTPVLREADGAGRFEGPVLNSVLLPPIPSHRLDLDAVLELEERAMELIESHGAQISDLLIRTNIPPILSVISEFMADANLDDPDEEAFVIFIISTLVLILVGTSDVFTVDLDLFELDEAVERHMDGYFRAAVDSEKLGSDEPLDEWFEVSSQPELLRLMVSRVVDHQFDDSETFSDKGVPLELMMGLVAGLIDILCEKLDRVR